MARIVDYQSLKDSIQSTVDNDDPVFVDYIDNCIQYAEDTVNRELRTMNQVQEWSTAVSGEFTALPSDFMGFERVTISANGKDYPLSYGSPYNLSLRDEAMSGPPMYYTVVNNQLQVNPPPDTSHNISALYWERIPALTPLNTTNWLVEQYPLVYLSGALSDAFMFVMDDQRATSWSQRFMSGVQSMEADDLRKTESGSTLTVRLA